MEAMGADQRPPAGALIERLLQRPQGFNLFQAISLLERATPGAARVGEGADAPEAVRLSSLVSFGFQASDVADVRALEGRGEPFVLTTPVMSLAGAQGPLPAPFTEMLLERRAARDHATADFLDIFNHRFLAFLYRSRKKHHIGLNWQSPQASALAGSLDALSSLGLRAGIRGPLGETAWLRHAGLLGGAPRSMTGLLAMLRDRLGVAAAGKQFCGGWRTLEPTEWSRLGAQGPAAPRLGRTAVIGRRVWDQAAGIEIELSDLPLSRLRSFLPAGAEHGLVKWMVRRYVQQELDVSLVLKARPSEPRPRALRRSEGMRLGWTTWLTGPPAPGARTAFAPVRLQLTGTAARRTETN